MTLGLFSGTQRYNRFGAITAAASVDLSGLTSTLAVPGTHATISADLTSIPAISWTTQAWGTSYGDTTYGTGANPTDFTASDGATLFFEGVGNDTVTYRAQATVRYAPGSAPAIADGQSWTVDDTAVSIDASASGANLTWSYALAGSTAGVTINSSSGLISGTPTAVDSGTATITATDQYGRTVQDTFTFTTAYRTQATGGVDLDLAFGEDSAITSTDLKANWTINGNTLTYAITGTALPTGLSVSSAGVMTGTPTDITADATYTLRGTDEYGRTTDDTFTLEITASDTTAPTITAFSFDDPNDEFDVTVDEGGTLYWASSTQANSPTFDGTTWTGTTHETGSNAISTGANSFTGPTNPSTPYGAQRMSIYVKDAAGLLSDVSREDYTFDAVPDAFVDADWSVATGSGANKLDVTITTLPSANGSTITNVQYRVDGAGTWTGLPSYAGTGTYEITMASAATSYGIELRAVNGEGNSAAGNSESATSGAAWAPSDSTATLVAHYDATDTGSITDTSGAVDQLDDQTANNYDLTASGTARPATGTRTINSLNVLDFDGSNEFLSDTALSTPGATDYLIMAIILESDSTSFSQWGMGYGDASGQKFGFSVNDASAANLTFRFGNGKATTGTALSGANVVLLMKQNGSQHNSTTIMRLNGSAETLSYSNGTQSWSLTAAPEIALAAVNSGGGDLFDGAIGEAMILNNSTSALATVELEKIEGYLAHKFGLESKLPGGHTYKSSPP